MLSANSELSMVIVRFGVCRFDEGNDAESLLSCWTFANVRLDKAGVRGVEPSVFLKERKTKQCVYFIIQSEQK
jgi:hypothetical protein